MFVSIITTDKVEKKSDTTKRSEHLDRKMPAQGQLHKKNIRETSNIGEEFGSDSSKVANCDSLNVSQSNRHVKGGKKIAKMDVAKGSKYPCIWSDSSGK